MAKIMKKNAKDIVLITKSAADSKIRNVVNCKW